jgi:hypothetical protein
VFVETINAAARSADGAIDLAKETDSEHAVMKLRELIQRIYTENSAHDVTRHTALGEIQLENEIDREKFDKVMSEPAVIDLLRELNIEDIDRCGLFDAIDCDGSGGLSIEELITGLMLIRGGFRKSDTVATRLAVKSVQKSVRNCRLQLLQQVVELRHDLEKSVLCSVPKSNGVPIGLVNN